MDAGPRLWLAAGVLPAAPGAAPHVPDYELLRVVGKGAYGDVWLARGVTGVYRAVKVVWRDRFSEPGPYEREFRGLREYARVSINEHRQLALLHVGRNDAAGFFYYVMELADDVQTGRTIDPARYEPLTLRRFQDDARRLTINEVVAHAVDLATALALLHDHGLIHRDIKPSNLILVDGRPKLADIGLVVSADATLTFVGTEGFIPPEGPGTPAGDVYSLGKVLYELATGRDRNDYPRLPDDLQRRPDRRELLELNEVILRACDPSPTNRYSNAAALRRELLLLQSGRSVRRLRLTERGLARARRAIAALLIAATVASAGAYLERQRAEREATARRVAEAERDLLARQNVYAAHLARAQRSLEMGDYGSARRLLQQWIPTRMGAPDLRGWEWQVLWREAQADPGEVLIERGPAVERVLFCPEGRSLAIHDTRQIVTLYDHASGQARHRIRGVHRLGGFSADSRWILGTTPSGALQAWDVASQRPVGPPQGEGINRPLAVLPQATARLLVFTETPDPSAPLLRLWDVAQGTEVARWPLADATAGPVRLRWAEVTPDGSRCGLLLQSGHAGAARFDHVAIELVAPERRLVRHPLPDAIQLALLQVPASEFHRDPPVAILTYDRRRDWPASLDPSQVVAIAQSPTEELIAAGCTDGRVRLAATRGGQVPRILTGHSRFVDVVCWSPDGRTLVSADRSGHVRRWQAPFQPAQPAATGLRRGSMPGRQLAFSPDGLRLAAALYGPAVGVFSCPDLDPLARLRGATRPIGFLSDGTTLLTEGDKGLVQWWLLDEARITREVIVDWSEGRTATWTMDPGGRVLAGTSTAGERVVLDAATGAQLKRFPPHAAGLRLVELSADGSHLAAISADGLVHLWRTDDGQPVRAWALPPPLHSLAFLHDGHRLAAGFGHGSIAILNPSLDEVEHTLQLSSLSASSVALPDNSRLICAARNGLIHVFRTTDWAEVATLTYRPAGGAGDAGIASTALDPRGQVLAVHTQHGRLRLWRTH